MKTSMKYLSALAAAVAAGAAMADGSAADKPQGLRFFNQHLTIKPYLSVGYTYDSNIDTTRSGEDDSIFLINPGVDFEWNGDRWALAGSLWYRYNAYCKNSSEMGENSFGESLAYKWTTSAANERGWSLMLQERFAFLNQSDGLNTGSGRGIWRDRHTFDGTAALERRFTDRLHADAMVQYNWMEYDNDTGSYAPMYGWQQWAAGLEAGFMASKWTDFLVAGGYAGYKQDDAGYRYGGYSDESNVWTVHGGIGSRATERISYRLLTGASWLDYGGHGGTECGWTYSLSGNWRVTRQFQVSLLGSSYYQPSERTWGQSVKVNAFSVGASYLTLGDKLNLTFNVAWRNEENVYNGVGTYDYDEDILSARIGATYTINRWMSVFANFAWEQEWSSRESTGYYNYDYDRLRGTVGMRFHY